MRTQTFSHILIRITEAMITTHLATVNALIGLTPIHIKTKESAVRNVLQTTRFKSIHGTNSTTNTNEIEEICFKKINNI